MTLDPRTPVLVGCAAASQRLDDPGAAKEAVGLMVAACEAAAADAASPDLLRAAATITVPKGSWGYEDAARLVATAIGAADARTVRAELGVLQTTPMARAADAIARGELDVALVVGGEARWREVRAGITGQAAPVTDDTGSVADEIIAPDGMIISNEEIAAGLVSAVSHYAMIENARRHADGQSLDDHAASVAELWSRFSLVARDNPDAWNRQPMTPEDIRRPGPRNKPLAWPYNKWHNSQWNVDQAACLILCSADAARAHGVPTDRWVFPLSIAQSNHMVPVSRRRQIHRSPGFALAAATALGLAGVGIDGITHVDLYSCFPIAVRTQALELGLSPERPLTVTGGMTFAGGPFNNYVLQSTTRMAQVLRADPSAIGLVTAISGMITKQAVSLWSAAPPANGYHSADVSAEVAAATAEVPNGPATTGRATVATYTVLTAPDGAGRAVALVDQPDGSRSIAASTDPALATRMTSEEWCGHPVELDGAGGFTA
jgi:acetyl-CoA C-acetyltransferase